MSSYPIGGAYSPWRDATVLAVRAIYDPPSPRDALLMRQFRRRARVERSTEGALFRANQYRRPRAVEVAR